MKKLLALLMAMVMMVAFFAACGDNKADGGATETEQSAQPAEDVAEDEGVEESADEPKSDEDMIKETVEDYFMTVADFDFEGTLEYVVPGSELYTAVEEAKASMDEAGINSLAGYFSSVAVTLADSFDGDEEVVKVLETAMNDMVDVIFASVKFEYNDISINGDTATASVKATMIDPQNVFGNLSGENIGNYISDEYKSMSEEEVKANAAKVFEDIFENVLKELKSDDAVKTETETMMTFEKIDGKWLIKEDE